MHTSLPHLLKYTSFSQKVWHKHCFLFLLGLEIMRREMENNGYEKFWRANKKYYGRCGSSQLIFKWLDEIAKIGLYYINTNKIPGELSSKKRLSSHMKSSWLLQLHNKSRLSQPKKGKCNGLVSHWKLHNKQTMTWPLETQNFFSHNVQHSKKNYISPSSHVISFIKQVYYNIMYINTQVFHVQWRANFTEVLKSLR